jgi:hypothetical protein
MLALTAPLKARLQALPQLTGWAVRTGTEDADRRDVPAADVRCAGATVADSKAGAVMVAPVWRCVLVVPRGTAAPEQLDAAMSAVICALHGWKPGEHGGRGWEALTLASITEAMFEDVGLVGYELTFATAARYMSGQR